jgi:hypothetical protein
MDAFTTIMNHALAGKAGNRSFRNTAVSLPGWGRSE